MAINNIKNKKPIPIYGKGENVRDWLFVKDHAAAIDVIFHDGQNGETYNIGGNNEWTNIDLIHKLCEVMDCKLNREAGESAKLITFVKDRAGHDLRYAIDSSKLQNELGWTPSLQFEEGIEKTCGLVHGKPRMDGPNRIGRLRKVLRRSVREQVVFYQQY